MTRPQLPLNDSVWISLAAAARLCRVSPNTMRAWLHTQVFPTMVGRGGIRVHRPSIEQRLRAAPAQSAAAEPDMTNI